MPLSDPPTADRRYAPWIISGFALVILCVFGRSLTNEFVHWDDLGLIVDNPVLHPPHWAEIWQKPTLGLYTPLSYTFLAIVTSLSWAVSGSWQPIWFHGANLLLHFAAVIGVWKLLALLIDSRRAAVWGALLFAVHPIVVEPVAWAASFNTMLSTALLFGALGVAVHAQRVPRGGRRRRWFIASVALYGLALLAKPSVCAAPLALVAIDRLLLRIPWPIVLRRGTAWLAISVPIVVIAKLAQPALTVASISPLKRLVVALDTYGFYLQHWLMPWPNAIDYGRTPYVLAFDAPTAVHISLAVAFVSAAVLMLKRWPILATGLLILLAGTLPVLGLVSFDFQFYSTPADRYVYFATFAPALCFANVAASILRRRTFETPATLMLIVLAALSFVQMGTWHDTNALMTHTKRITPDSLAYYETVGYDLAQRVYDPATPPEERKQLAEQSAALFHRALEIRPGSWRSCYNLGNLLLNSGRPALAIAEYRKINVGEWNDAKLQNNWGIASAQLHDLDSAILHFDAAIRLTPRDPDIYANKAAAYLQAGQREPASAMCNQALRLNPNHPKAIQVLAKLNAGQS